jgi:hypothetical protein
MTTSNFSPDASLSDATIQASKLNSLPANTTDANHIPFGARCRLPRPEAAASTADTGRIRFGGGMRIPAVR